MQADYEKTAELLAASGLMYSPAEIHGVISGILCGGQRKLPDKDELVRLLELEGELPLVIYDLIRIISAESDKSLSGAEFGFQLLLPADEEALTARLLALGAWCDSFAMGFAFGQRSDTQAMTEEVREILRDFAQIAEVEVTQDLDLDQEQNEEDYVELVEYVRLAATSLYLHHNAGGEGKYGNEQEILH